jgi:hypothetical protein
VAGPAALAASMVITSQFKEELEPKSMTSGQLIQLNHWDSIGRFKGKIG